MIARDLGCQGIKGAADVAEQTDGDVVVRIHLSGKSVDVDDLGIAVRIDPDRVELLKLVTGGDDHVGSVEAEVDVIMAHEADRTEGEPMIVGQHTLAVKRCRYWDVERFGESAYRFSRLATGSPVTGQQDGVAGAGENLRGSIELCS